jgi:hypothetical protein
MNNAKQIAKEMAQSLGLKVIRGDYKAVAGVTAEIVSRSGQVYLIKHVAQDDTPDNLVLHAKRQVRACAIFNVDPAFTAERLYDKLTAEQKAAVDANCVGYVYIAV